MRNRYRVRSGENTPEYDYDMHFSFKFKGVDIETGSTFIVEAIRDLENDVIMIKCRKCHNQHSWKESMEDQWASGLCQECLNKEQSTREINYIMRVAVKFDDLGRPVRPSRNKEWNVKFSNGSILECSKEEVVRYFCHSDEEIRERCDKLKHDITEQWTLIKFENIHIEEFDIEFVDHNSEYTKIIENRAMDEETERMIKYETWKRNNFDILLELLYNWKDQEDNEILVLLKKNYPDSTTPGGAPWNLRSVKLLREYLNLIPKDVFEEWQKWEKTIIGMLQIKKILIPKRHIIFKNEALKIFSYKEIDALIKIKDSYFIIDAKYKGGDVDPQQGEIYKRSLENLGYSIEAVIFITAEEGMSKKLTEDIYSFPSMIFKVAVYEAKDEDKMLFGIRRFIGLVDKNKSKTFSPK